MSITEQAGSMTDAPGPVGAELAKARAANGMSIDDVCRRTNIRPVVVRALENGDIAPSGGAVYARGHVRTLAQALGLPDGPLLAAFDKTHATNSPPPPVLVPDTDAAEVSLRPSTAPMRGPRWPLAMAAVLIVVITIALIQLILPGAKDSAKHTAAASPLPSRAAGQAKPSHRPAPSLLFPVPAQGVTLRLVLASKPSWLDITDERGVQLIQRVVGAADRPLDLHTDGRFIRATIGDASAVSASCNGHPLGVLGGPKQVVTLTLTRGDPQCPAS